MIEPLNNNVLIEVQEEYSAVSQAKSDGLVSNLKFGKVIDWSVSFYHLTASAGIKLSPEFINDKIEELEKMVGMTVRWEEFAEGGQTFERDGKTYALIPWWRLIGYEEGE